MYPNPVEGNLHIELGEGIFDLVLVNLSGVKIIEDRVTTSNTTLDLSELTPGIYFLKAISGTNEQSFKIVKL